MEDFILENVNVNIKEHNGYTVINIGCRGLINPEICRDIDKIEYDFKNKKIILNGRIPVWLFTNITEYLIRNYKPLVIATNDAGGGGAIVCYSNSKNYYKGYKIKLEDFKEGIICPLQGDIKKGKGNEIKKQKVIVFVGPPHSGKSCLLFILHNYILNKFSDIYNNSFYILRACPDGEGNWCATVPDSILKEFRYKQEFNDNFLKSVIECLENLKKNKNLIFVDCGGKIDKKNQQIWNNCTHAIIVSNNENDIPLWEGAIMASELSLIAKIKTDLSGENKIISKNPLYYFQIVGLQREKIKEYIADEIIENLFELIKK
ncbi:MAG: CRISPR-associated protein Csx3 [Bacteroidales bacterium]|nr:CRISPR-associated protein Csx3 [Bacteroidales bacterium]